MTHLQLANTVAEVPTHKLRVSGVDGWGSEGQQLKRQHPRLPKFKEWRALRIVVVEERGENRVNVWNSMFAVP